LPIYGIVHGNRQNALFGNINNGAEYELTRASFSEGEVYVGDVYRGKPVTSIAKNAFKAKSKVTKIVVGNNVKTIGDSAFYNCSDLETVVIPESVVSLGKSAFHGCKKLQSVVLPDSITEIKDSTFAYCRNLSSVEFGDNLKSIGSSAFNSCDALTQIDIPDTVESIGAHAFSESKGLKNVTIGKNVSSIGEYAFAYNVVLESCKFDEGSVLEVIPNYCFTACEKLAELVLPENLKVLSEGAAMGATELEELDLPDTLTDIGRNALVNSGIFLNCVEAYTAQEEGEKDPLYYHDNWIIGAHADIENVSDLIQGSEWPGAGVTTDSFREGVVGIAGGVFRNNKSINRLYLPASIKYIGSQAFELSEKLWDVKMADNSVVVLNYAAFSNCQMLSTLRLGAGLVDIDDYAFIGCKSLRDRDGMIPETVTHIGTYAFFATKLWETPTSDGLIYAGNWLVGGKEDITDAIVKDGTKGISDYAFNMCLMLTSLTGRGLENIEYIGQGAFRYCISLGSIILGNNLKRIEDFTFYGCTELFSIELPPVLEYIGKSAFFRCGKLPSLDLSNTKVETIGKYAFYGCENLKTLNLGSKLEEVSERAFYNCLSLETINIPDNIKVIGERAFYGCIAAKSINLGASLVEIGASAFSQCQSLGLLIVPSNVQTIGKNAFYGCSSLVNLVLEDGIKTIGDLAFYGANSLIVVFIPDSIETIGNYAFRGCTELTTLIINGGIEHMGVHSFYGSNNLTVYTNLTAEEVNVWNVRWNSSNRPVVTDCVLSEDGSYVVSTTISEDSIINFNAVNGVSAPIREGYTFMG
ncbi:MAG: leucine-rich repeat protein, partial [Clostridia bacterium]|nr:leucine-rich repeat protein [Clostridia bacterium]